MELEVGMGENEVVDIAGWENSFEGLLPKCTSGRKWS
jgi:hypothetical protein